ncbi:MAG: ribosomal protein S18-alanine N-acetyltransferase [Candidatus Zixiibacteriota bacterium]
MKDENNNSNAALIIREMTEDDLPRIMELEHDIFPDPWPESAFLEQIYGDGWGGLVAASDGRVIGYGCYLWAGGEAHLTNLCVDSGFRRKSVARALMRRIFEFVRKQQCESMILEVRPSNQEAIAFYLSLGFEHLYRRPAYYRTPTEDALVMRLNIERG